MVPLFYFKPSDHFYYLCNLIYLIPVNNPVFKYLLIPFTGIYWIIVLVRNKLYDLEILPSEEFNLPVISVGNLTVGGTGKTPHTEYLINLLKDEFRVAVISRGYKRKTRGFILADSNDSAATLGDEPFQMFRKYTDIQVVVDESRRRGIKKLLELKNSPDVILLDDAFQHRSVKPGLSILLVDYNRPVEKDMLLPSGRLREPFSSKRRANLILITKCPGKLKAIDRRLIVNNMEPDEFQHIFFTGMTALPPQPVFGESPAPYFTEKENKPSVLMVSGIAGPRTFKPFVRKLSTKIRELTYPDHHDYTLEDIRKILEEFSKISDPDKIIVTTEKDSVKWLPFRESFKELITRVFYIPAGIGFLNDDANEFNTYIKNYVRNNKKSSRLYSKSDSI